MKRGLFTQAVSLGDGPERVAALAAWVQSLPSTEESKPVLVGGAAVELYSGGAYRTGDLDFVGTLGKEAELQLEAVGFQKRGRHWVHEEHRIFLEFPGSSLQEEETVAIIEVGQYSVLVIGLEELILDRLAAWQFWDSEVDGVNALRLVQTSEKDIDWTRLRKRAETREVTPALEALERFVAQLGKRDAATTTEIETWAMEGLKGIR